MSSSSNQSKSSDFIRTAAQFTLLSAEQSIELAAHSAERGISPAEAALDEGLLTADDVQLVQTLVRGGEVIPGYELLGVLGRGGMGVVYRARQQNLDRIVALKTVLVAQLRNPAAVARFEQEAVTVGRLRHPNIVAAYDFGKHGGRLYLAMELVEGQDVEHLVRQRGRLDELTTWAIIRQAAAALAHAAREGIIHRDIKPANLLVIEADEELTAGFSLPPGVPMVKVTDFGLALLSPDEESSTRLTMAGTVLGSPQYMAPEQFRSSAVDQRADIYALGTTAYQMLSGQHPYPGQSFAEVLEKKLRGLLPSLDELPENVSQESIELLRSMMAVEPEDRPANYRDLLARLDERLAAAGATTSVRAGMTAMSAPPRRKSPQAQSRTRRISKYAGGIAVALGLALAIWHFGREQGERDEMGPGYVPSGWLQPLYDGQTLNEWTPLGGLWSHSVDAEGGHVLAGNGTIRRQLPQPAEPASRPLANYCISIGVNLHEGTAVELHFAVVPGGEQPRYVVRITKEGATLGQRSSADKPFEPLGKTKPPSSRADNSGPVYREVRVERHGNHWRAYFDGQSLGSARIPPQAELPEFQLATEGGTVLFDSLQISELVAPKATRTP